MNDNMEELPETEAQKIFNKEREDQVNSDLLSELVDHVSRGDNYIPWEPVTLPSQGIYYGDKIPYGRIEVKPMGVDVDKLLTNQRLIENGSLPSKIVEVCTRLPDDFSVREMLAGDFNFLLYYLRGITHGNSYEFISECPYCKTKNNYTFDLSNLQETVQVPNENYLEEPMEVHLPKLSESFGKSVNALVRLIRVDDIMKMSRPGNDKIFDPVSKGQARIRKKNNQNKTQVKNAGVDASKLYQDNMKRQIVALIINSEEYKDDRIFQIIDTLHQKDAAVIRDFIEEISPGVDTSLEVTCQNTECAKDTTIMLPWSENFFRSNN
ncbi:MAG: hypothetical protein GF364_21575 [Candidatus Lokiarchaeota archaeon]|nr:hypothetical protein [Candidatus Lokiarchaeota archaeon]